MRLRVVIAVGVECGVWIAVGVVAWKGLALGHEGETGYPTACAAHIVAESHRQMPAR